MNNRKYLIISSATLIVTTIIYLIFANIFSLSTKNDGLFSKNISIYKWVIRFLTLIPFIGLIILWFAKKKFIHTYGINKRAIKYNIYYSVIVFVIELLLLILIFIFNDAIKLAIISWVSVALFGVCAYLESTLTYKLYFY